MFASALASVWHNPRLMQWLARILVVLALALLVAAGVRWVIHRALFSIEVIQLVPMDEELRHVNVATARAAALPKILNATRLNFFTVNLETIRQSFESVAWVRHAEVSRVWPNRLLVEIEEHQLLGTWNEKDEANTLASDVNTGAAYSFLNTHGEVFAVNPAEAEDEAELPEFSGPVGSEKMVVTKYRELTAALAPLQLQPDQLSLSSRYAWSLHALRTEANAENADKEDAGLDIELGREIEPNILSKRMERLRVSYPLITAQWPKPTLIDLRYPNGFALRAEGLKLVSENAPRPAARALVKKPQAKPSALEFIHRSN